MQLDKDSFTNTFLVATVLCLVCSLLVSAAAVGLKPIKNRNVQLDRKKNILWVTGFTNEEIASAGGIEQLFKDRFETWIIDLETGERAPDELKSAMADAGKNLNDVAAEYDQMWAAKSKKDSQWAEKNNATPIATRLDKSQDVATIKYRENYSQVFVLKNTDGSVQKYVFPVRGMGLWSMMQGYLSVEPDLQTVAGLTFYDQAETPGLGGEVMNPKWKKQWTDEAEPRKQLFNNGEVALQVIKGDQSNNPYGIDALSGATITSNGVTNLVQFWMGPNGFGPFIEKQKSQSSAAQARADADGGVGHG